MTKYRIPAGSFMWVYSDDGIHRNGEIVSVREVVYDQHELEDNTHPSKVWKFEFVHNSYNYMIFVHKDSVITE